MHIFVPMFALTMLLISWCYSGGLVSFLTVTIYPKPISEIEALATYHAPVGAFGIRMKITLQQSKNEAYRALSEKYVSFENWKDAFQMVLDDKLVAMDSQSSLNFNIRKSYTNQ